ncbi:class II aldolase/adducin family protein [Paracoccus xiamenensis]|uniref:class II aldolase/adducin family protein n=1 Tax=Paracoccus xiamenensis TaxID=2714901 RepID=UPI00140A8EF8|nr:class II aldolase/adducin family protein [Paracoccus xiamenensis]NHF72330.1 class II aldolase [Paracoccus xiamenensis]
MAVPEGPIWDDFLTVSARIGGDVGLVQGAGGNTSLKDGATMWIKASGTWLADAATEPVMVPVDLAALRGRVLSGDLMESEIAAMTLPGGPAGLRASVEAPFHALLPGRCVIHVHCVDTIAMAILADGQARLAQRLPGVAWHWQPYVKPGVRLTMAMRAAGADRAAIIVLGNHGLIVSADTPLEAEELIADMRHRLGGDIAPSQAAMPALPALEGTGYAPAQVPDGHDLALSQALCALAGNCAIAPDFVVFFGPSVPILQPGPDLPARLSALSAQPLPLNAVVLVEGQGALIRTDAMRGTEALLAGYAQVLKRYLSNGGGEIRYFSPAECAELLNWEAEKYRQAQNRSGQGDA